ncbi:MAG TPA: cache domain-containing protein, partial [Atribacterota bacterium]|nr:cache domain-containing protein [Atribacterota bacterium]
VKLFKPLGWYLGTGEYVEDFEKEVQTEVLKRLSNIRYGQEGYIFVNTYNGDALIKDGKIVKQEINLWDYKDPNGVKVIQEERKAAKNPDGGYIFYSWKKLNSDEIVPKMSYVKGIPEWQWIVGAGIYFEDVNPALLQQKAQLRNAIQKNILTILIVFGAVLTFLFVFTYFLSKKAKANVSSFLDFFKNASQNLEEINESKLDFNEFKTIAHSANHMIRDIKFEQKKKKEDEAVFERLFESAPEAIALIGNDGKVIKVNNAFPKLFGYSKDELINKNVDDFIVPDELKNQAKKYHDKIIKGQNIKAEEIRIRKDKSRVFVSILSTPITYKKDQLGVYVIYRDITQQKETERILHEAKTKAEESDRLKSAFLTNMSHEVRTPMNAITGFSNLILNRELSEKDKAQYLNIINQSSNALLEIIDNIIDVSKLEAENLVINKVTSNINTILDELYIDISQQKKESGLKDLEIKLIKKNQSKSFEIITDPKRFKQIFANLLDNALKFTEKGVIEFGYTVEEKNLLCFVKDTGIGFTKEESKYIFDPFRQADLSSTRKYGGTGLGLTLAHKLVELLGGTIDVESEKNKGSHFYFSIPFEYPEKESEINTIFPKNLNWENKRILIAEDVPTNYQFLYTVLKRTKADITWAKDGEEVIKLVEKNPRYHLILMDIQMPKMNGHNAFKYIRNQDINIPVIAQTAYAMDSDIKEIKNLGY